MNTKTTGIRTKWIKKLYVQQGLRAPDKFVIKKKWTAGQTDTRTGIIMIQLRCAIKNSLETCLTVMNEVCCFFVLFSACPRLSFKSFSLSELLANWIIETAVQRLLSTDGACLKVWMKGWVYPFFKTERQTKKILEIFWKWTLRIKSVYLSIF